MMRSGWIVGLGRVKPGDQIEVWDQQQLRHLGTVSQVAPHLGVLWIVEATTGLPKLIQAREYRLCFAPSQPS
ncbi:hypothetical protein GCM10011374_40750 [Kocuria dechangensis]|uniref:Uncharacterized protein n=1 Tax=Kocuria dechangensis TaxID=1176249 RepID=A0A917H9S7_9MICC|nr:hypothetical protein [Kocuria dechangensis]GGG71859.1 hypothetical protein GCM10011374_40750 [Kocuria dechangensis]